MSIGIAGSISLDLENGATGAVPGHNEIKEPWKKI